MSSKRRADSALPGKRLRLYYKASIPPFHSCHQHETSTKPAPNDTPSGDEHTIHGSHDDPLWHTDLVKRELKEYQLPLEERAAQVAEARKAGYFY